MFLTISRPASAYIDGGSGSYLLQILFATMFGAIFTVKSTYVNMKAAVLRRYAAKSASHDNRGA
jgi:hypothetical protein